MVALRSLCKYTLANTTDVSAVQNKRPQRWSLSPRWSRIINLIILSMIGICLVSSTTSHQDNISVIGMSASSSTTQELATQVGTQAGGVEQRTVAQTQALPADCSMLDINCDLNSAAQWVAQGLQNALQPIIDAIDQDQSNFVSQTPICVYGCPTNDSPYQSNATILTFVDWSTGVVNVAVAAFIALLALNIIIARQIGSPAASSIAQSLPRIALAVMAANLSMYFLQFFLDLENALCLEVIHLQALTILTNMIVGIFRLNLFSAGLIMFAVAVVLAVMNMLLAWQMLVRLALLILLIVLAPLGLFCFGLPQTQGYGRLWAANFAMTVFVQFFQVVTLALGGMLVTYVSAIGFFGWGQDMTSLFVSIAVIYLVLRIPAMVRTGATTTLGPIAGAGPAAAESVIGIATRLVEVML